LTGVVQRALVEKGRKRGFEHEFGLFAVVFVLALEGMMLR